MLITSMAVGPGKKDHSRHVRRPAHPPEEGVGGWKDCEAAKGGERGGGTPGAKGGFLPSAHP